MEGLFDTKGDVKDKLLNRVIQISKLDSNSLAMLNKLSYVLEDLKWPPNSHGDRDFFTLWRLCVHYRSRALLVLNFGLQ